MLDKTYRTMNEKLTPSPELNNATLEKMAALREGSAPVRRRPARRVLVTALACVLVLSLSVTALAAAVPGFRAWLFGPESGVAEHVVELEGVTAGDGIEMELLGAMRSRDDLVVYFTLRDATGQGRLEGDMTKMGVDAQARVRVNGKDAEPMPSIFQRTSLLDYDPDTQTLLCRYGRNDFDGVVKGGNAEVEFTVSKVYFDVETHTYIPVTLPGSDFWTTETEKPVGQYTGGLVWPEDAAVNRNANLTGEGFTYLKPVNEPIPAEGFEQVQFTAMGFVDGKLYVDYHFDEPDLLWSAAALGLSVQSKGKGEAGVKEYLDLWAEDYEASLLHETSTLKAGADCYGYDENGDPVSFLGKSYVNHVYYIAPEELDDYEFYMTGTFADHVIKHDWTAEFQLSEAEILPETKAVFKNVAVNGETFDLEFSPLNLKVSCQENVLRAFTGTVDAPHKIVVYSGEKAVAFKQLAGFVQQTNYDKNGEEISKTAYATLQSMGFPIDPEAVTAIEIDGERVELK